MKIETISREHFNIISGETDIIDRTHYGKHEIVVGYHEASGFTLFLVGPSSKVVMASERGSLPAFVELGLVATVAA
jgi:hypothetical protein